MILDFFIHGTQNYKLTPACCSSIFCHSMMKFISSESWLITCVHMHTCMACLHAYASMALESMFFFTTTKHFSKLNYKTIHLHIHALKCRCLESAIPLPETIQMTPMPAGTILLMKQIDEGVVTADKIKTWTWKDPILSQVQQVVWSGWPTRVVYAKNYGQDATARLWLPSPILQQNGIH